MYTYNPKCLYLASNERVSEACHFALSVSCPWSVPPLPPISLPWGLSQREGRSWSRVDDQPPIVREGSKQSSALCMVQTLSRTQYTGPAPPREAGLFVALFIGIPKNKKYLLNAHRHTLKFEARGPSRKSSCDFYYSSFLGGDDSELFHIDTVKGVLCGRR